MSRSKYDVGKRPGWRPVFSSRFEFLHDKCPRCTHSGLAHFYWIGEDLDEIGCAACFDNICVDRKAEVSMSALNLCERCDSLMLGKAVATLNVRNSPDAENERVELCPGCVKDFYDFMHSGTPREQRAFKEPYRAPENDSPKELT